LIRRAAISDASRVRRSTLGNTEGLPSNEETNSAPREALSEAAYQRCYVHFLRNALDYAPRRVDDDCLQELRWLYDRRDLPEARRDLAAWLAKWSPNIPASRTGSKKTSMRR
jgi:transposase-like protein